MMAVLPSGLNELIAADESIARFVFSKRKEISMAIPPGCLKPAAFLPNPKTSPLETSVFRHSGEPLEGLWQIARKQISNREPKGVGILLAGDVREADLEVIADENPPCGPRHANIVGWEIDGADPKANKANWKDRANVFASKAKLKLP